MQKQEAWADARSSSGLVRPPDSSILEAHETSISLNAPLDMALTTPLPDIRSPSQTAFARRTASAMSPLLVACVRTILP